jgi:hypothetical protein
MLASAAHMQMCRQPARPACADRCRPHQRSLTGVTISGTKWKQAGPKQAPNDARVVLQLHERAAEELLHHAADDGVVAPQAVLRAGRAARVLFRPTLPTLLLQKHLGHHHRSVSTVSASGRCQRASLLATCLPACMAPCPHAWRPSQHAGQQCMCVAALLRPCGELKAGRTRSSRQVTAQDACMPGAAGLAVRAQAQAAPAARRRGCRWRPATSRRPCRARGRPCRGKRRHACHRPCARAALQAPPRRPARPGSWTLLPPAPRRSHLGHRPHALVKQALMMGVHKRRRQAGTGRRTRCWPLGVQRVGIAALLNGGCILCNVFGGCCVQRAPPCCGQPDRCPESACCWSPAAGPRLLR